MLNHILSPNTQVVLLLCGSFGQNRQNYPQPLTLSEYNLVARWLREEKMTPKDLIGPMGKSRVEKIILSNIDSHRLIALLERGVMLGLAVEKWANQGIWILGRSDAQYPKRLKEKLKLFGPPLIYGVGNMELLSQGGLAVVGSRHVDEEMIDYTKKVAETCAQQGIQVISGGAGGIDQTAILGVLDAGGTSVAVLAGSLIKESLSKKYRQSIKDNRLTLISVYDPDASFSVGNAMGRNKYIYGLSDYGLVVDSSLQEGGTWNGAVEALEKIQSVPVFVRMEGRVNEAHQQLIQKGALPFPQSPWTDSFDKLLSKVISKLSDNEVTELTPLLPFDQVAQELLKVSNATVVIDKQLELLVANRHEMECPNQDAYTVILPLILSNLRQPKDAKSLAESLNVRLLQVQDWLKKAVNDGVVRKNKKPVTYEVNSDYKKLG